MSSIQGSVKEWLAAASTMANSVKYSLAIRDAYAQGRREGFRVGLAAGFIGGMAGALLAAKVWGML